MLPTRALLASLVLAITGTITTAVAQEQTARLVIDANRTPLSYGVGINWVAPLGNSAVFSRSLANGGPELWISDGTTRSTRPVREAPFGPESWYTGFPVPFGEASNAKVAFYRISPQEGEYKEVWITDGTDPGTLRVSPAVGIRSVSDLTATTHGVFFLSDPGGTSSPELIFSDGTQEGTRSLNPGGEETPTRFTSPRISFTSGPWCYFIANQNDIWRSDGTDAGTTKIATFPTTAHGVLTAYAAGTQMFVSVRDFWIDTQELWALPLEGGVATPLSPPSISGSWYMREATTLGEQLFFGISDDEFSLRLMVSDGTQAGTREIAVPTEEGDEPHDLRFTRWHGSVYCLIAAWDEDISESYYELYRIDDERDELTWLARFGTGAAFYSEATWREQEDFLYLSVWNQALQKDELWQTKGTATTTRRAKGIPARHYLRAQWDNYVTTTGSGIYYAALGSANPSGLSLWFQPHNKSAGALRLTRPEKWTASGIPSFAWYPWAQEPLTYDTFGGKLLSFVHQGITVADDHELWSMNPDGTQAKPIWKAPGPMDGTYANFGFWGTTPHGAIFYFSDGHAARQIYRTDGTRRGTRIISDHSSGPDMGFPLGFAQLGDQIFYSLTLDGSTTVLWKTDGTPEGTMKIVAADGTEPMPVIEEKMVSFQGSLYFLGYGPGGKIQLWRTDGTPAGTIMLNDQWFSGTPTELTATSTKLLFTAKFYTSVLWQSDGTAAGTIRVPGAPSFPVRDGPTRFTDIGNGVVLFQAAPTGPDPLRWFRHDATGTYQLPLTMTSFHFPYDNWDQYHAVLGNKVIYNGSDDGNSNLWITDGTAAGTHKIDVTPGSSLYPSGFLTVGNHVYFSATNETRGTELWRTDGTEAGTVRITEIDPTNDFFGASPSGLKLMNGKLYFAATRRDVGRELFSIDLPQ